MSKSLYLPEGYSSALTLRETQHAIKYIKDIFQQALSFALTLDRVSAPLIVRKGSGINDDLNGVERKVDFDIKEWEVNLEGTAYSRAARQAGEGPTVKRSDIYSQSFKDEIHGSNVRHRSLQRDSQ